MIVKVTYPDGLWHKYRNKINDPKEAIMTVISTKVRFTRPGRIEWVIDPLSGDLIFALIEDAEGLTTLEVITGELK